jgi:hypothetical protein
VRSSSTRRAKRSYTTNANATEDDDGRIVYDFGNAVRWEFVADPSRGFPVFGTTVLRVGGAKRVKEQRTIASSNGTYLIAERLGRSETLQ